MIFKYVAVGPAGSLGGLRLPSLEAALCQRSKRIALMGSRGSSWGTKTYF